MNAAKQFGPAMFRRAVAGSADGGALAPRRPPTRRFGFILSAEPALAISAHTMIAVLHDNAVIVSVTRLMIDTLSLTVDVAFDQTI